MDFTVFFTLLIALQLICLWAGSRASYDLKNQSDYFLAGRQVKFFPLLMTFIATQVGGGLILGSAEEAYQYGWPVLLYPLGACLGFLVLAAGIGKQLAKFKVSTVAQLFEVVYKSTHLKQAASLLSIVSLFMILVAQVVASKKFMVSLELNQMTLFIGFWLLIIVYTVIGGLKAVVSIDIIQASFFLVVFAVGFGYILYTTDVAQALALGAHLDGENFDFDESKLTGWLFMPLLFMVIEQDMAQRCFAAQSPRIVSQAALWSAIVIFFISIIPVAIGILGNSLDIQIAKGSSVFMTVVQALTNPVLSAAIACAVLMAIISTAISLINAVSSNLTQDFRLNFLKRISSVHKSQGITAVIGLAAVILSFYFQNIVDLLIQSYELSVYCLFIPVIVALFKPHGNKVSAVMAIIFGAVGFVLFRYVSIGIPKEIASVMLSGIGYGLAELWVWNRKSKAKHDVV